MHYGSCRLQSLGDSPWFPLWALTRMILLTYLRHFQTNGGKENRIKHKHFTESIQPNQVGVSSILIICVCCWVYIFYSVWGFASHLNEPSAFTAAATSSSIPEDPPHQYALQRLNGGAFRSRTAGDAQRQAGPVSTQRTMSTHNSHLTPNTASCWLPPPPPSSTRTRTHADFLRFGRSMDFLWSVSGAFSTVDFGGVLCFD